MVERKNTEGPFIHNKEFIFYISPVSLKTQERLLEDGEQKWRYKAKKKTGYTVLMDSTRTNKIAIPSGPRYINPKASHTYTAWYGDIERPDETGFTGFIFDVVNVYYGVERGTGYVVVRNVRPVTRQLVLADKVSSSSSSSPSPSPSFSSSSSSESSSSSFSSKP